MRFYSCLSALFVIGAVCTGGPSMAQQAADFPSRPIRLVVSQSAGGSTDAVARLWAERAGKMLNTSIVVENKPGAGGAIAAQYVIGQPADGHTLFLAGVSQMVLNKFVYRPLAYSPEKDFVSVSGLTRVPFVLVAGSQSGIKTFQDLKTAAAAAPSKINFASSGNGNSTHIVMEMLMKQTGLRLVHVPFRGEPDAAMSLAGGSTQVMAPVLSSAMPLIKRGQAVPLVMFDSTRAAEFPNVPTAAEVGLTGLENVGWTGIVARAGTPQSVIDKLHAATQAFLDDPAALDKFSTLYFRPLRGPSTELARLAAQDTERWRDALKDLNLNVK